MFTCLISIYFVKDSKPQQTFWCWQRRETETTSPRPYFTSIILAFVEVDQQCQLGVGKLDSVPFFIPSIVFFKNYLAVNVYLL